MASKCKKAQSGMHAWVPMSAKPTHAKCANGCGQTMKLANVPQQKTKTYKTGILSAFGNKNDKKLSKKWRDEHK